MVNKPARKGMRKPARPQELCEVCKKYRDWECRVKEAPGPRIVHENLISERGDHPVNCVSRRCTIGQTFAGQRLMEAKRDGNFLEKRTSDGLKVIGVDASAKKPGFVDEKGNLYIYAGHDPNSPIVIPTGQTISSLGKMKAVKKPARRMTDKERYGEEIWGVGAI